MTTSPLQDVVMTSSPLPASSSEKEQEPKYGGFTRFEIELEFVQCLANPHYLLHLATLNSSQSPVSDPNSTPTTTSTPLLQTQSFIAYLAYLRYFTEPQYIRYLTYPGPTLKNLELLQNERFRREILSPDVVARLVMEGATAMPG